MVPLEDTIAEAVSTPSPLLEALAEAADAAYSPPPVLAALPLADATAEVAW